MDIRQYLDATYLKTPDQAGLTLEDNTAVVKKNVQEAIEEGFKLVMIRPDMVSLAKKMIIDANAVLQVGTVIDFPKGESCVEEKLDEAHIAIQNGADDLDFVCNYKAFKNGEIDLVKQEIFECTQLGLDHNKVVKWIIEVAALTDKEIIQISSLIKNVVVTAFSQEQFSRVFVKSSTGFYETETGVPNGATLHTIKIMLDNASPLPVKAAGGVRTHEEAVTMINLGVKRIGTSGAKIISDGQKAIMGY
jgi:deoxyribose-phosphate aldolase